MIIHKIARLDFMVILGHAKLSAGVAVPVRALSSVVNFSTNAAVPVRAPSPMVYFSANLFVAFRPSLTSAPTSSWPSGTLARPVPASWRPFGALARQ